ncbi:heavy metal-associated isoprenylated plant protein 7 [Quercus lobata]|uniref:heavy metal-associated isoprenylated plant protein 7 n=1 Tax=Quercus lobata TaxID=97700 RepID=UPI001246E095|nr:heavy metal-associated isoprenylated plant protein 7 [Quercus lobata]
MGEEEKKPEEKKMEEKKPEEEKKEEKKAEEKKEEAAKDGKESKEAKEEAAAAAPPPPQEIVLKVYMHCEGCARKVRRCLKGFEGVEDVITDCKISKVVVKGEKADPLKVLERVQRKSHRQVELISPIPKPKAEEEKKPEEAEKPKPEEKKEEPQIITVVLKVHMHCEACAQEIKKRILKMKGVESAEPDLKSSEVTVKGVFDPPKLVEYVYKRTGKHAVIVKQEPEKKDKEESKDGKEEKKAEEGGGGGDKETKAKEEKKEGKGEEAKPEAKEAAAATTEETNKMIELQANAFQHYPQRHFMEMYQQRYANEMYAYPPQIFSDENPNACSVM